MHYMLLHSYNLLLCVVLTVATDNYYYMYTICNVVTCCGTLCAYCSYGNTLSCLLCVAVLMS